MSPHELGLQLRALVIRDRAAGLAFDPQRLQALVSDLAGVEHADLVAPLRFLVLSAAFASAARQDPPLAGAVLLPRLRQELSQMFAEPVCARLQPVLEGLLGLPADASGTAGPSAGPRPAARPVAGPPPGQSPPTAAPAPARAGTANLNAVLLLLCGALLLALAGLTGLWRLQRTQPGVAPLAPAGSAAGGAPSPAPPAPLAQPPAAPPAPAPGPPAVPAIPEPPADAGSASADTPAGEASAAETQARAQGSVERLVSALSEKDFGQVDRLIGMGAADQFEPGFYNQFAGVSVEDLRPTGQRGAIVDLEGVMVFRWPDGRRQRETRRFSVDSAHDPPLIVSSRFGRVLEQR
jgi:hypothetical protein